MAQRGDAQQLALLQLNLISGIGPRIMSLLLNRFGDAVAVLRASAGDLLQVDGVGPKLSAAITAARSCADAEAEWERCESNGVQLLFRDSAEYPEPLSRICDAPPVLYVRGELKPADSLAVALVGSRQCTLYGRQVAGRLAAALCHAGVTVISGLARGIDAAAHRGSIEADGRTLAVCANGLGKVYPPEHRVLADEVVAHGALLSESPFDRDPNKGLFPQRNRIISGMCQGVVIVEAGRGSGALHTARHAMEQGREVFAVPGRIDAPSSMGCHDLIRDGVTLVRSVDDILDALGPLSAPVQIGPERVVHAPRELNLNDQELAILNLIETEPTAIDTVLAQSPLDSARVLSTLTVLEMKRLIRRLPGGFVERTGR